MGVPHRRIIIIVYSVLFVFLFESKSGAREDLPNILLFTIDACRPDHFGCYGYARNTTPNIDKLANEGVLFTHAFSQSAWTTPGMISIFTSLYPPTHTVDAKDKTPGVGILTLPKVLKTHGYTVPVLPRFVDIPNYWHLGFDTVDKDRFQDLEGEDLLELMKAYKQEKFFIWYHYHGLHLPYNPPAPYDRIFQENTVNETPADSEAVSIIKRKSVIRSGSIHFHHEDKKTIVALYDGQLRQLDDYVGRLLGKMKDWGILENTLIIMTSDHGEELFEHGFVGHASTSLNAKLYDEMIRIPLIMWWPKRLEYKKIEELVQQIDIMPTILDILGLTVPEELQGNSLLPLIQDKASYNSKLTPGRFKRETIFCETILGGYQSTKEMEKTKLRCIRTHNYKLIYKNCALNDLPNDSQQSDTYELYDLRTDPKEVKNIGEKNPEIGKELKKELFQWIKETTPK